MTYQTLRVEAEERLLRITFDRPERQNSINDVLLHELHRALDASERAPEGRVIVLEGQGGVFCTGLDLDASVQAAHGADRGGEAFLSLLKRIASIPRVVISVVDGQAAGGGVGVVAASDFVLASERATFSLPEALWGLLPCCVLPFLLRRVGFQKAYTMTLSTQPVTAAHAAQFALVDEVARDLAPALRKLTTRLNRIHPTTLGDAKRYFAQLAGISSASEAAALAEFARLMASPVVRRNLETFVATRRFPWEPATR
jgi:polyketide biosynthesis enoyl-CoA hydratase PksH